MESAGEKEIHMDNLIVYFCLIIYLPYTSLIFLRKEMQSFSFLQEDDSQSLLDGKCSRKRDTHR